MRKAYFPALATGPSLSKTHHQKPTIKSSQFLALFNPLYELAYVSMFIPHCHLKVCVCVCLTQHSLFFRVWFDLQQVSTCSHFIPADDTPPASCWKSWGLAARVQTPTKTAAVFRKSQGENQQERTWKQCGALPVEGRFVNWPYYQDKSTRGHKKTMAGKLGLCSS